MVKRIVGSSFAAFGIFLLIFDASTALTGARDGIDLCIRSIIPSIFPFLVLSAMLTSGILGTNLKIFRPLGRLTGIPTGAETIFITGLLGGYPIGAQAVQQAWQQGQLNRKDARRMLGFCSNAGPSFLFGILGMQFENRWLLWALWGIHILSAIAVGALLPGKSKEINAIRSTPITLPQALRKSVITMGMICGWVILFRVILAILDRWVLWLLPIPAQVGLHGLLELANGCCSLLQISSVGLRFIIASTILAFGGVCVLLQTVSVTENLGIGQYLIGKMLQTMISIVLSTLVQSLLLPPTQRINFSAKWMLFFALLGICIVVIHRKIEKRSSIPAVIGV